MSNNFSTATLIEGLKSNEFIQLSSIPMSYVPGLPILSLLNDNLCIKIPYLKYKVTGEVDKTLVFPIKYIVTITIPEGIIVEFKDMDYDPAFAHIEFNKPIGIFRHEALKNIDKTAYRKLRNELYEEYDKIINHLSILTAYTAEDEMKFKKLLNVLLEPSLRPFYKAIDKDFAKKYIID